jgi:glucose-1-phosphate thymidylyltransferase
MKGIILAGGFATRLYPTTTVTSKQLLPVYDKPMVYYPISLLMMAGIKEFLIITNPNNVELYELTLPQGKDLGISIRVVAQDRPAGLPFAFTIAKECGFLQDGEPCTLMLGDNVLHGHDAPMAVGEAILSMERTNEGAVAFCTQVKDASPYGVATFDVHGNLSRMEEKPNSAPYGWAIIGLYVVDSMAAEIAAKLSPSGRGETEILEVLKWYKHHSDGFQLRKLGRGFAWFDAGSPAELLAASSYIAAIQERQGNQVACLEEIAMSKGWITPARAEHAVRDIKNEYGDYVRRVALAARD